VVVKAGYTERGQTVEGPLAVRLVIAVTPRQLVLRNLLATIQIKQGTLRELDAALERERASLDVLLDLPSAAWVLRARARVRLAICREEGAHSDIEWSIYDLSRVVAGWRGSGQVDPTPPNAPPGQDCSSLFAQDGESVSPAQRP
jgi:hypothetical protein